MEPLPIPATICYFLTPFGAVRVIGSKARAMVGLKAAKSPLLELMTPFSMLTNNISLIVATTRLF